VFVQAAVGRGEPFPSPFLLERSSTSIGSHPCARSLTSAPPCLFDRMPRPRRHGQTAAKCLFSGVRAVKGLVFGERPRVDWPSRGACARSRALGIAGDHIPGLPRYHGAFVRPSQTRRRLRLRRRSHFFSSKFSPPSQSYSCAMLSLRRQPVCHAAMQRRLPVSARNSLPSTALLPPPVGRAIRAAHASMLPRRLASLLRSAASRRGIPPSLQHNTTRIYFLLFSCGPSSYRGSIRSPATEATRSQRDTLTATSQRRPT
jgi:hypothetical protein